MAGTSSKRPGIGRACSKLILLGEHTVLYGGAAIAVGLERGAHATAWPQGNGRIRIGSQRAQVGDGSPLGTALGAALTAMLAPIDIDVEAVLEIPAGSGLGASAALGVSISRAVAALRGSGQSAVQAGVDAWESVFHGAASGIDAATAADGGCIEFRRTTGPQRLALSPAVRIAVAVAGPPASTKEMVEKVRVFRELRANAFDKALGLCESLVARGKRYLMTGNWEGLGDVLNTNHDLLCTLGVSTPELDEACRVARRSGALGAKLTGSGGGGCVVAITDADPSPILSAWADHGFVGFEARVPLAGAAA